MNFRLIPSVALALFLVTGCATPAPDVASNNAATLPVADQSTDTEQSSQTIDSDSYLLGQGDAIAIQVFDEPDLTLDTVVSASGSINYSYLGDIRVAGKSPVELEQHIAGLLRNGYLVNPSVNVRVTQYRPFYINGEVRSPGSYPYQPGLTLDRAIALAGGLTDRASTRKMYITKADSNDNREIRVPMNWRVQPGDTVTIKEGFF